jgi:hypothetical protein
MAKRHAPLISVFSALISIGSLVGCQSNSTTSEALPPPSFDAPRMAAATPPPQVVVLPPRPTPVAPQPKTYVPPTRPQVAGNVPKDWIPPVPPRDWEAIVVHHSATTTGGAAAFDKMHRAKGWDELGYDFVIGNGTDTADGQIEVGSRWVKQKVGAHAKTPDNWFNEHGIGICLVGNFDVEKPTPKQLASLDKLVAYMMRTYHIPADHVLRHKDTKSTDCPGRYLNIDQVRRQAAILAGMQATDDQANASTELLTPIPSR